MEASRVSWRRLEAVLGESGGALGAYEGVLEASSAVLRASWRRLGDEDREMTRERKEKLEKANLKP